MGEELLLQQVSAGVERERPRITRNGETVLQGGNLNERVRNPTLRHLKRVWDDGKAKVCRVRLPARFDRLFDAFTVGWERDRQLRSPQETGGQVVHAKRSLVDPGEEAVRRQVRDPDAGPVAVAFRREV